MTGRRDPTAEMVKLRSQAEGLLAEQPPRGGIRYPPDDCQRLLHVLHAYETELDLMGEELEANRIGLKQWRDDAKVVQAEFREVTEKLELMTDCPEKVQLRIQCVEATLHFLEGRFRRLLGVDPLRLAGRKGDPR